jgi:hypothetical protein
LHQQEFVRSGTIHSEAVGPFIAKQSAFAAEDVVPIAIVTVTAAVTLIWNLYDGLQWQSSLFRLLPIGTLPLLVAFFYSTIRPRRAIAEAALFLGLWLIYPIFAARLSYLAAALAFPLQDDALIRMDAALGFDWHHWVEFVIAHRWFAEAHGFFYQSFIWQPLVSVGVLAWFSPGRNREMLTSVMIAATITIVVATFMPARGPAHAYGIVDPWDPVISALRAGSHEPLPIAGIVTFPSFHTAVAVLLMIAHRGIRWSFPLFAFLNAMLIVSIPYYGHHYLSDVLAGALVAGVSFFAARALLSVRILHPSPDGSLAAGA